MIFWFQASASNWAVNLSFAAASSCVSRGVGTEEGAGPGRACVACDRRLSFLLPSLFPRLLRLDGRGEGEEGEEGGWKGKDAGGG
jgi:hypothetical protein